MTSLRPFFTYFGGKWRIAPRYPAPIHKRIIEPFAGAAGYALRYADREVILIERNPVIAGIWRYLIQADPAEIRALPDLAVHESVHDYIWPCSAAQHLAGMWLTRGGIAPNVSASAWMRDPRYTRWSWGPQARERIASQVEAIRHWQILEADYTAAPTDRQATWFIDPPYQVAGRKYTFGSDYLDFTKLGAWCQSQPGQVIVCENEGANWLPFSPFYQAKANESLYGGKRSLEAIWYAAEQVARAAPTG